MSEQFEFFTSPEDACAITTFIACPHPPKRFHRILTFVFPWDQHVHVCLPPDKNIEFYQVIVFMSIPDNQREGYQGFKTKKVSSHALLGAV